MGPQLKLIFWGTRGLISTPSKENLIYGGNTTCIQILLNKNYKLDQRTKQIRKIEPKSFKETI